MCTPCATAANSGRVPEYVRSSCPPSATTMNFIVNGANAVVPSSCVHRSLGTWPCHLTTRHWRTHSCGGQRLTSSGKKCRGSRWLLYWRNLAGTTLRATETFGANSENVSVWELAEGLLVSCRSRFELCGVIHANDASPNSRHIDNTSCLECMLLLTRAREKQCRKACVEHVACLASPWH